MSMVTAVSNFFTHFFLAFEIVVNACSCRNVAKAQDAANEIFGLQCELDVLFAEQLDDMQKQINELRAEVERLKQE